MQRGIKKVGSGRIYNSSGQLYSRQPTLNCSAFSLFPWNGGDGESGGWMDVVALLQGSTAHPQRTLPRTARTGAGGALSH